MKFGYYAEITLFLSISADIIYTTFTTTFYSTTVFKMDNNVLYKQDKN